MFIEELPDIEEKLIDAVGYIGELPLNIEYENTRYVVRVLWALEVAFYANIGPLRASDITKIIRNYGKEPVEPTNVARFFREAKRRGEYQELWNENKLQHYTISTQGKDTLNRIMKVT